MLCLQECNDYNKCTVDTLDAEKEECAHEQDFTRDGCQAPQYCDLAAARPGSTLAHYADLRAAEAPDCISDCLAPDGSYQCGQFVLDVYECGRLCDAAFFSGFCAFEPVGQRPEGFCSILYVNYSPSKPDANCYGYTYPNNVDEPPPDRLQCNRGYKTITCSAGTGMSVHLLHCVCQLSRAKQACFAHA